jgi:uncharacterized membrane protein
MTLIWLGLIVWCAVHAMPSVAPEVRGALMSRLGANGYKIAFALAIVLSVLLMVLGWRSADVTIAYDPPVWGRHLAMLLMLLAFMLFAFSHGKSNLKRWVRHPQLTAVVLWAIAHLLANGDNRAVVTFGVLGLWALVEMVLISRRDGAPALPAPRPWSAELRPVVIGAVVFVAFLLIHPYLFGVSPIGA